MHSDAPTGRIPCEIKIETGEAFTSQIVPKISVSYKRNGTDFSPQALKITSANDNFDLGLLASKTVRQYIFVV